MAATIRLEEYTGVIQSRIVCAWQPVDGGPWLPTEFMLSQYITRILVTGRTSPMSAALTADSNWTQVWRSPGGKEWSCLLGVIPHMPGPVLIVVGPDVTMSPKLVAGLADARRGTGQVTVVVLRSVGSGGWAGEPPDQVFFPVLSGAVPAALMAAVQEWSGRAAPRALDLAALLPQLAAQGYGLTVSEGVWQWYRPADSPPLATLSVAQIARQLQILGSVLERATM
jgi:hypothetical protein